MDSRTPGDGGLSLRIWDAGGRHCQGLGRCSGSSLGVGGAAHSGECCQGGQAGVPAASTRSSGSCSQAGTAVEVTTTGSTRRHLRVLGRDRERDRARELQSVTKRVAVGPSSPALRSGLQIVTPELPSDVVLPPCAPMSGPYRDTLVAFVLSHRTPVMKLGTPGPPWTLLGCPPARRRVSIPLPSPQPLPTLQHSISGTCVYNRNSPVSHPLGTIIQLSWVKISYILLDCGQVSGPTPSSFTK